MTDRDTGQPSAPIPSDATAEPREGGLWTPDRFMAELFDRARLFVEHEYGGDMVAEFDAQTVRHWFAYSDFIHSTELVPFVMSRGLMFRNRDYDFGLATGRRSYDTGNPTVGFGLFPHQDRPVEPTTNRLHLILTQHEYGSRGSAEVFYVNRDEELRLSAPVFIRALGADHISGGRPSNMALETGVNNAMHVFRLVTQLGWNS